MLRIGTWSMIRQLSTVEEGAIEFMMCVHRRPFGKTLNVFEDPELGRGATCTFQ
jgi:hypothetical protein